MKIVFLDIDGVIQPYESEFRFYEKDNKLIDKLSEQFNTDYKQYSYFDINAVYNDWDEQAVDRVKYVLEQTNSKIIVSSDWRSNKQPNKMRDLLKIHGLDKYYFADNIIMKDIVNPYIRKSEEITHSLNKYDIDNFVVLDDLKQLENYFADNCVITTNIISNNDMKQCIRILKR